MSKDRVFFGVTIRSFSGTIAGCLGERPERWTFKYQLSLSRCATEVGTQALKN